MAETSATMDGSAVDVKDENEVTAVYTTSLITVTDLPNADEIASESVIMTADTKPSTVEDEPVVADCITTALTTETAVDVNNSNSNSASIKVDELNVAMASATISIANNYDVKQNQGQIDLEDSQLSVITQNENVIIDNVSKNQNKQNEELNSTIISVYEDAHEYIDEDNCVKKEDNLTNDECIQNNPDENCNQLSQEKEEKEGFEEDKSVAPTIPVAVDDDTNDPQYIPRRGRFYEHDDRMAYSTTSSEELESDTESEENSDDDSSVHRHIRRRHANSKTLKSSAPIEATEKMSTVTADGTSSKRVLAISKVAATATKNSSDTSVGELPKKPGRKSRAMDSLDRWSHDMYDEQEQMPKTQDELLETYGYNIRAELEAPRARRHHKYGRAATTKYTRNWQDTQAYNGTKMKRGGLRVGSPNKNKNSSTTTDDYTTEFPTINKAKPSESTATAVESSSVLEDSSPHCHQQVKSVPIDQEKLTTESGHSHQVQLSKAPIKHAISPTNNNHQQEQQNNRPISHNKNMFNRPSVDSVVGREKSVHINKDFYNRKPSQYINNSSKRQGQHSSTPRGHNLHQPQFNRDRYFTKGTGLGSSFNQPHQNAMHAGTGRTLHGSGHFNNRYNDQQYENENQPQAPVVRSSKRYSVQSRRELPNPVLNFSGMSKTPQPQQQISVAQPNGLVMQEPPPSQLQQQPIQIHQQQSLPPIQMQQYQPLPQLHHGMVLDHNTGMMVMAEPPIYHQLYAGPQYSAVTPVPATGNADDQNALQILAQAAVYHPVSGNTQSLQPKQSPETFMTTFYQPQQQNNKQPPPRRINLAIPIVAPPESNQNQTKTMNSPTTASTN